MNIVFYDPKNWFQGIKESEKFLEIFIEQVEQQISSFISDYELNKTTVLEERYDLEGYKGFDDSNHYSVKRIVKVEFPNYHRKSAFITLHSFLDVQLNNLCDLFKSQKKLDLSVYDIKSDNGHIGRATKYLTKVVGLDWDCGIGVWSEINSLRTLRNKIVHEDGKITEGNKKLINYISNSQYLDGDKNSEKLIQNIVITSDQFLNYALSTYINLCEEFYTAISNVGSS
ncbi:MAG: hypothetical protein M3405_08635 [Acidobacteriota bacterium]|jgi:hypothetical protein|nr:hypothetical protein [Acidobacteriota bacterium]